MRGFTIPKSHKNHTDLELCLNASRIVNQKRGKTCPLIKSKSHKFVDEVAACTCLQKIIIKTSLMRLAKKKSILNQIEWKKALFHRIITSINDRSYVHIWKSLAHNFTENCYMLINVSDMCMCVIEWT